MYCKNCKKEISDGAVFCEFCGAKQKNAAVSAQRSESDNPAVKMKKERSLNSPKNISAPTEKSGRGRFGFGAVVAVIAVVVIVIILLNSVLGNAPVNDSYAKTTVKEAFEVAARISASELLDEYKNNEINASQKYKGKRLRVTGIVDDISQLDNTFSEDSYYIYVNDGDYSFNYIRCCLKDESVDAAAELKIGDEITIEGRCDGYSAGNVKLYDCMIIK